MMRKENVNMVYSEEPPLPQHSKPEDRLFVRYVVRNNFFVRQIRFSSPHRAELELQTYGRDYS